VDFEGTVRKPGAKTDPHFPAPVSELYIARCDFMRRQMEDPNPGVTLTPTVLSNPLPLTCLGKDYGSYTNSLKLKKV
jgi:hypothetical protein